MIPSETTFTLNGVEHKIETKEYEFRSEGPTTLTFSQRVMDDPWRIFLERSMNNIQEMRNINNEVKKLNEITFGDLTMDHPYVIGGGHRWAAPHSCS